MKYKIVLAVMITCTNAFYNSINAQQYNFAQWANDTLQKNDARLQEFPSSKLNAEDVLNNNMQWKNPYATVLTNDNSFFAVDRIGTLAAPGKYPRIFTSSNEFNAIQQRLQNTKTGNQLLTVAKDELAKIQSGKGIQGIAYQQLLQSSDISLADNFPYADFANALAVQGLFAQLQNDKTLLQTTATVAANFIKVWINKIDATPQTQGRELMVKEAVYGHGSLAKLFDFTATGMSDAAKKVYINFMLKETTGKYGDGMQLPPHWRRWNHIASALAYPLSVLAIENEKGFDKRIYERGIEVLQDYLTYTFSAEGMSNEGITYTFGGFADDLLLMAALAKRGHQDVWYHPHFRKIEDWLIQALAPNPDAMWSSHGDTGSASELPWLMLMIMKYYFPTDEKIDYLLANAMPEKINKLPDVSAFVFATDAAKTKNQYNGIPPVTMNTTFFSPQRGSFITRNEWNKNAIQFQLDGRQDMLFQSHDHSDRGNFELAANGRLWVVDGWRSTESKYHSVITIDGRGQGYFATPATWLHFSDNKEATFGVIDQKYAYDWMWLKSPVADLLSNKTVAPQWQNSVYADAAKNLSKYYPGAVPQRDPLRKVAEYFSGNLTNNPLIWNEDTWPMRLPNYEVAHAFRTAGLVKGKHTYALIMDDIQKDNTEKLYEWNMPMPLDVEVVSIKQLIDVKQESGALNIGFNTLTNKGIHGEYDIVLGDKRMKRNMKEVDTDAGETYQAGRFMPQKGDLQLLVRVLDKTAAPRPNLEPNPRLEVIEKLKTEDMHQFYLRTMDIGKRLVIPSRSSNPNFKVLLFPYLHGEELPQTIWNENRTQLTVRFSNQEDIFYFTATKEGRTRVKMVRNGNTVFDF
jgi:hypothetical protein